MGSFLKNEHFHVAGLVLVAFSAFASGVKTWGDMAAPSFIIGAAGTIGAVLRAYYAERPGGEQ
jgi:hypothetical protein